MTGTEVCLRTHRIGGGRSDPAGTSPAAVGSKAYGLMRMDALGLPVPPALVFETELCTRYHEAGGWGFLDGL